MQTATTLAVKTMRHHWKQNVKMALLFSFCAVFVVVQGFLLFSYVLCSREERDNTFGVHSGIRMLNDYESAVSLGLKCTVANNGAIGARKYFYLGRRFV